MRAALPSTLRGVRYVVRSLAVAQIVLCAWVVASVGTAQAAVATVDPSFGAGGWSAAPPYSDRPTAGRHVERTPDGGLMVAGRSGRGDVVVERVRPDGTPDPLFGTGGRVVLDLGTVQDDPVGIHARRDGRLLVGVGTSDELAFVQLLPNGLRDPTFGDLGVARFSFEREPSFDDVDTTLVVGHAMGVARSGDAVIAGRLEDAGQDFERYAFVRVDGRGRLVPGFGNGGVARLRPEPDSNLIGQDSVDSMVLPDDGSVVLTGRIEDHRGRFVRRITPEGTVDRAYDGDVSSSAERREPFDTVRTRVRDQGAVLRRLADGRVLVGRTEAPIEEASAGARPQLLRLLPSGDRDPAFGSNGLVVDPDIDPLTAVLGPDASVYVLGSTGTLRRLRSDGTPDDRFTSDARGDHLIPLDDGLEVVGLDDPGSGDVRRTVVDWDGSVRTARSASGALRGGPPAAVALAAAEQRDGRIVLLTAVDGREGGLTRLTASGLPDRTFGADGVVPPPRDAPTWFVPRYVDDPNSFWPRYERRLESRSPALDPQDRILTVLPAATGPAVGAGPVTVRRYVAAGSPDVGFGDDGTAVIDLLSGDAPQVSAGPDSSVTVLGDADGLGRLVRLTADGRVDTAWGVDGVVAFAPPLMSSPPPFDVSDRVLRTLPDGRVVAAMRIDDHWYAARFTADGAPDPSYGRDGWTRGTFSRDGAEEAGGSEPWWPSGTGVAAAIDARGRVVVGDVERSGDGSFPVVRIIAADGRSSDPTFAPDRASAVPDLGRGPVGATHVRVAVQPDGRPLLAVRLAHRLRVTRFQPDGGLDTSFGDGGTAEISLPDGRVSAGWATSALARADGRSVVTGDARGDASAVGFTSGEPAHAKRPVLTVRDQRIGLRNQTTADVRFTLSEPADRPIWIDVVSVPVESDGAIEPVDRRLTIPSGERTATLPVRVLRGDDDDEPVGVLHVTSDDARVRRRPGLETATVQIAAYGSPERPSVVPGFAPQVFASVASSPVAWCLDGSWTGTRPMTFSRTWQRGGVDVPGETDEMLAVGPGDRTGALTCRVTATNEAGSTSFTTAPWRPTIEQAPSSGVPTTSPVLPARPGPAPGPVAPPAVEGSGPPSAPAAARIRVRAVRLTRSRLRFRTSHAGPYVVQVSARGAASRALRRAGRSTVRRVRVVARRPGAVAATLGRRLLAGSYAVRVFSGTRAVGRPAATVSVRLSR